MPTRFAGALAAFTAVLASALSSAAASSGLGPWFAHATSYGTSGLTATKLAKPDFFAATNGKAICHGSMLPASKHVENYDTQRRLGLAVATTDQCSMAVFEAPPPGVSVADADLSSYKTQRGLHVGSSASSVAAAYGGSPPKGGRHTVAYTADFPEKSPATNKMVQLSEDITLVLDGGRVTSVMVAIDESAFF